MCVYVHISMQYDYVIPKIIIYHTWIFKQISWFIQKFRDFSGIFSSILSEGYLRSAKLPRMEKLPKSMTLPPLVLSDK